MGYVGSMVWGLYAGCSSMKHAGGGVMCILRLRSACQARALCCKSGVVLCDAFAALSDARVHVCVITSHNALAGHCMHGVLAAPVGWDCAA